MRKGVPKEAKVKDIRNFFNSRKEADTPDVLKSELITVENEIKKIDPSKKKTEPPMSLKISKERLEHMLWFMEPKLHSNFSLKLIQSILFLEHPITIGNSIVGRTRNEKRERKGWPNLHSDDLIAKVKTIMIGTCNARIAISHCIVMAVGNGVVKSNNPVLFKEIGGSLQLTEDRARGVLRSMKWMKRKGTTWETEPSKQFLLVEKLTF